MTFVEKMREKREKTTADIKRRTAIKQAECKHKNVGHYEAHDPKQDILEKAGRA